MHKDVGILLAVFVIAAIVAVWVYVLWPESGPAAVIEAPQPSAEAVVEFTTIASGDHSGKTQRKNYLYWDEAEFETVWEEIHPEDPMPDVNFEDEGMIVLYSGEKTSGGYSIAVEKVVTDGEFEIVHIVRTEPGAGCVVTQAITTPFTMVKIPITDLTIKSEERVETVSCT